jgi:hypothetical protein
MLLRQTGLGQLEPHRLIADQARHFALLLVNSTLLRSNTRAWKLVSYVGSLVPPPSSPPLLFSSPLPSLSFVASAQFSAGPEPDQLAGPSGLRVCLSHDSILCGSASAYVRLVRSRLRSPSSRSRLSERRLYRCPAIHHLQQHCRLLTA